VRVNNSKGQVDRILYLSPDTASTLSLWQKADSDKQEGTCDKPTQKGFPGLEFLFLLLDMADITFFRIKNLLFTLFEEN